MIYERSLSKPIASWSIDNKNKYFVFQESVEDPIITIVRRMEEEGSQKADTV